jgi:hypothetical protein
VPTLSWKQGTWDSASALYILYSLSDSLFSYFPEKEAISFWAAFSRLVPSYSLVRKRAERANSQFRTEREIDRAARSGPSRDKKRLAQDDN